ncbi:MAG: glycoside hydrolase family 127 protein [Bacteroidales bacterium]|nr:glycoside hydrolase family 127 protein [Bacteroidales bacterium]
MSVFSLLVNGQGTISLPSGKNLAVVATPTSSSRSSASMTSLNDGLIPNNTSGMRSGGNRPPQRPTAQLVQYEWTQPVSTREIAVFWWNYENTVRLPQAYRIKYWDGNDFVPVKNAVGLGLENNLFNITKFDQVMTTKLRLEVDSVDRFLGTMLEWMVIQAENSPNHSPVVTAGVDRSVMLGGKTYLSGGVKSVAPYDKIVWSKVSGPGNVNFADANSLKTTATFSLTGDYILSMTAKEGNLSSSSTLKLKVQQPPQAERLDVVYTKRCKIDSPFWNNRAKAMIVNWIPWCINQINRTDLTLGEGGLDNFIEAGKALRGEPHGKHLGYVFSNAWVHQTIEAMSIALMVDPQDDKEIIAAQEKMKTTIEKWIPIILAAQEPDGYLQTAYTLRDTTRWKERWAPRTRGNHEGYVAGYFIESAINHYTLTEGKDKRLYDAAKKLADCWVANIGPGKKEWYDGHQEMEQALVRFGRFVNDMEGNGRGDNYINLSKFLLNCRRDGSEYDQSNVPVQQQYEAVGHAVRAVYSYSAMADVAAETGDIDYQSAVMSLWENMVNKKYYITGGVGSGETSEGFGPNYSLRNNAYCESCSSCGLIFFQYKMNIAYNDAKYADLYEETIYNALLGSLDLEGKNFYYTNGLSTSQSRYSWHVCPCCVGNIPRTLLMIPTWTYLKSNEGLYVNLFIGSTIKVEKVAETDIEMIQKTDYPWSGEVSITVNPKQTKEFTLFVRVPNRTTSSLYTPTPAISGLKSLTVNGKTITPKIVNGYAVIKRTWKAGDKVNLVLPMGIQTITADGKIEAVRGRVALRYGPMIYNVEKADQPDIDKYISTGPLTLEWRGDLLNGVMTIKGKWDDGAPLLAIPNYARNNRNSIHSTDKPGPENKDGGSIVWIKKQF